MRIDELLSTISKVANKSGLNSPFLVGGVPRDRIIGVRGEVSDINDIDITTGDQGSVSLAKLLSQIWPKSNYREYDDKHSSINVEGIRIDFSSNFIIPGMKDTLIKMGVKNITPMKLELYSRDFTMNTLLEELDFSSVYDLTNEAIDDIKAKLIKCPVDPEITIGADSRRILRAIKFSIKYKFNIDDKLKMAMNTHRDAIKDLPVKFVQDKISEIVNIDADEGIERLIEYKILPLVPLTKMVYDTLIQKRKLIRAL